MIYDTKYAIITTLRANITDPLGAKRQKDATGSTMMWISSDRPIQDTQYPYIEISINGGPGLDHGIGEDAQIWDLEVNIRIYGCTTKERDDLTDDVIDVFLNKRTDILKLKPEVLNSISPAQKFTDEGKTDDERAVIQSVSVIVQCIKVKA